MPFVSEKQRRWMHATHPAMAERWEHETKKEAKKKPRKATRRAARR
jgi:hypothetical protein